MADYKTNWIAEQIAELRSRMTQMEINPPSLHNAGMIVPGKISINDGDGNEIGSIGIQPDGSMGTVVNLGPTPPRPYGVALGGQGFLELSWDGRFYEQGVKAPADFLAVEALVRMNSPSATPVKLASWPSIKGGVTRRPMAAGVYYVQFQCVSKAGTISKAAPMLGGFTVTEAPAVDLVARNGADAAQSAAAAAMAQAGRGSAARDGVIQMYFNPSPPAIGYNSSKAQQGDLWINTTVPHKLYRVDKGAWAPLFSTYVNALDFQYPQGAPSTVVKVFVTPNEPQTGFTLGDLWVVDMEVQGSSMREMKRWDGTAWVSANGSISDQITNKWSSMIQLANSKTRVFYQMTDPVTTEAGGAASLTVGDSWYNPGMGNQLKQWDGQGWNALAWDSGAIASNAITSDKIVTGAINASKIAAGSIVASHLVSELILTTKIILGDATANRTVINAQGIASYRMPGGDGGGDPVLLGRDPEVKISVEPGNTWTTWDYFGGVRASISASGAITGMAANLGMGRGDVVLNGRVFEDYVDEASSGFEVYGRRVNQYASQLTGNIAPLMEVRCPMEAGRSYLIQTAPIYFNPINAAGGSLVTRIHCAYPGVDLQAYNTYAPTYNASGQISSTITHSPRSGTCSTSPMSTVFTPPISGEYKFLVSVQAQLSNAYMAIGSTTPIEMWVSDMGKAMGSSAVDWLGEGQTSNPSSGARATYLSQWALTSLNSFYGNGSERASGDNAYHGVYGNNGNQYSWLYFNGGCIASSNGGEVGKTIGQALSGATVVSCFISYVAAHTWYNSGATFLFQQGGVGGQYQGVAVPGQRREAGLAYQGNLPSAVKLGPASSTGLDQYGYLSGSSCRLFYRYTR